MINYQYPVIGLRLHSITNWSKNAWVGFYTITSSLWFSQNNIISLLGKVIVLGLEWGFQESHWGSASAIPNYRVYSQGSSGFIHRDATLCNALRHCFIRFNHTLFSLSSNRIRFNPS